MSCHQIKSILYVGSLVCEDSIVGLGKASCEGYRFSWTSKDAEGPLRT